MLIGAPPLSSPLPVGQARGRIGTRARAAARAHRHLLHYYDATLRVWLEKVCWLEGPITDVRGQRPVT